MNFKRERKFYVRDVFQLFQNLSIGLSMLCVSTYWKFSAVPLFKKKSRLTLLNSFDLKCDLQYIFLQHVQR